MMKTDYDRDHDRDSQNSVFDRAGPFCGKSVKELGHESSDEADFITVAKLMGAERDEQHSNM